MEFVFLCVVLFALHILSHETKITSGIASVSFIKDEESRFSVLQGTKISEVSARILDHIPSLSRRSNEYILKNKKLLVRIEEILGTKRALMEVPGVGEKNVKLFEQFFISKSSQIPFESIDTATLNENKGRRVKNSKQKRKKVE